MNAAWASVIAGFAAVAGTGAGVLWRGGRRDGRVDAVLERLTDIAEDHEERIRIVEHGRPRARR